jgi:hypothetical protein
MKGRSLVRGLPEQTGEDLRLWTVQAEAAWDVANRRGVLRSDGRRVWREHRLAYRWMREQMRARVATYAGPSLIWSWYRPKPDLRFTGLLPPGTEGVRIEFVAPACDVLLSDFDGWHVPLSSSMRPAAPPRYLSWSRTEDEEWERQSRDKDRRTAYDDAARRSWERIFDLQSPRDLDWCEDPDQMMLQAVLEEVRVEQVIRVQRFLAR